MDKRYAAKNVKINNSKKIQCKKLDVDCNGISNQMGNLPRLYETVNYAIKGHIINHYLHSTKDTTSLLNTRF